MHHFCLSDTNECNEVPGPCSENAICTNTDGGYSCACNAGFEGNGVLCEGRFPLLVYLWLCFLLDLNSFNHFYLTYLDDNQSQQSSKHMVCETHNTKSSIRLYSEHWL